MEALLVPERGAPKPVAEVESPPDQGFVWLDFDRTQSRKWAKEVESRVGFSVLELHVIDSLNPEHPSYSDRTDHYEMVVFRGLAPDAGLAVVTEQTTFFLFERVLVTVHPSGETLLSEVRDRLLAGKTRIPRRPVGLMHLILTRMVDEFLDLRMAREDRIETWQSDLLDPSNPFDDWMLLMKQRSELRRLEVLCEEQQEAIDRWMEDTGVKVDAFLRSRFRDLIEHVRRVLSHSQHLQAQIESLVQIHFSGVAHRTNEIVRVLTVLSAIFLPLTFLAGIFGMNFVNMPELHSRYGYFITLSCMAALALVLAAVFKRKRWF